MRRDQSGTYVVWQGSVRGEVYTAFNALMPMSGARTWFIQTAVDKLINLCEDSPRMRQIVHDDIQKMLHGGEEDKTGLHQLNVRITQQSYNRFNAIFPEWGGTSWFFRRMMGSLVAYMSQNNINLEELVEVSVNNAVRTTQETL